MTRLQTAAKDALLVQDACNLSGVLHTWHKHMEALWAEARDQGHGTEWVNTHPINQLFCDKVAQLTQGTTSGYSAAYAACEQLARSEPAPPVVHRENRSPREILVGESSVYYCKRCHEEAAFCVCIKLDALAEALSMGIE